MPCNDKLSQISSLTPFKSHDQITPLEEFTRSEQTWLWVNCRWSWSWKRHLESLSAKTFTNKCQLLLFTYLGLPAKPTSPFKTVKLDSFVRAPSLLDAMTKNHGQDCSVIFVLLLVALFIPDSSTDCEEESDSRFPLLGLFLFV